MGKDEGQKRNKEMSQFKKKKKIHKCILYASGSERVSFLLEPTSSSSKFSQHCTVNLRLISESCTHFSLGRSSIRDRGLRLMVWVESNVSGAIRAGSVLSKQSEGALWQTRWGGRRSGWRRSRGLRLLQLPLPRDLLHSSQETERTQRRISWMYWSSRAYVANELRKLIAFR